MAGICFISSSDILWSDIIKTSSFVEFYLKIHLQKVFTKCIASLVMASQLRFAYMISRKTRTREGRGKETVLNVPNASP